MWGEPEAPPKFVWMVGTARHAGSCAGPVGSAAGRTHGRTGEAQILDLHPGANGHGPGADGTVDLVVELHEVFGGAGADAEFHADIIGDDVGAVAALGDDIVDAGILRLG